MHNLDCVFLKTISKKGGDNPLSTVLIDVEKKHFILNLWSPWHDIADYIEPYTTLKIFNIDKRTDDNNSSYFSAGSKSIVVIDPDILINATAINNVSFCPRSYYISQIIGETASPYIAIRGSIVHDCLGLAVSSGSTPSTLLPQVLDNFSLQYEYHGYRKESVYQDVRKMTECLDPFVSKLGPNSFAENLFLSSYFGIRGRIDLYSDDHIYELKTGKISEEKDIRFSDLLQVTLYRYGIQEKIDDKNQNDGSVIYVGTNEAVIKTASPNWGLLRYGMEQRNIAYKIYYQGFVPPILPESQINKCRNCFVKHFCALLCAGLDQERRCTTCPHEQLCTQKALPQSHQNYFNRFSELVRLEKNEAARNLSDLWNLTLEQRLNKGKTIHGVKLENEIKTKDSTQLLFSCENESELREGDIVILSSGKIAQGFVNTGVVSNISTKSIEIDTKAKIDSVSTIDVYSIDVGFRRQQRGLFNLVFKRNNFRELVIKEEKSIVKPKKGKFIPSNAVQNQAVEKILGTENYCLIQGPAGTGKTYVISKSAIELAKSGEKILLTAFTNRAVDNICKYLLENKFENFIRLGSIYSIQPEFRKYTLEAYRERLPDKTAKEIIEEVPIVIATTSTISNPIFEKTGIQTIIIDEASQMTEPTVLSALLEGNRFILVGDHKQLPPVVQSTKSQKGGMSVSLFERLAEKSPDSIHLLTHQFRMNEKLIDFSNKQFYNNKLESFDDLVKFQSLIELANFTGNYQKFEHSNIYNPKKPLVYIPTSGIFNAEKKLNTQEAEEVSKVVKQFLKLGLSIDQIGVISPYRGQVGEIRRLLPTNITVDTVDRFQGSDRELIVLSLTENQTKGNRGFSDERRLNVAITRGKKKLVVIGSSEIKEGILGNYTNYLKNNSEVIEQQPLVSTKTAKPKQPTIVAENLSKTAQFFKTIMIKGKTAVSSKEDTRQCMVCYQPVYENAIECPACEHLFHFKHLLNWIMDNERCPYCKTILRIYQ